MQDVGGWRCDQFGQNFASSLAAKSAWSSTERLVRYIFRAVHKCRKSLEGEGCQLRQAVKTCLFKK